MKNQELDIPLARHPWYVAVIVYGVVAALAVAFCCTGGAA